jgi:hypothetical protein
VRKEINFNPENIGIDLTQLLQGLSTTVFGVSALRNSMSDSHARECKSKNALRRISYLRCFHLSKLLI